MKFCIISDTHDQHENIELEPADVLIHCGDLTFQGTVQSISLVNNWFGRMKEKYGYKKIIITPGNHDWLFEKQPSLARTLMSNATVLINEGCIFEGVSFWGSPITPRFFNWAFNRDRGADINRYWQMIPEGTDVIITHGPPHGFGDRTRRERVGCEYLIQRVEEIKPSLHCFGHIHGDYGRFKHYTLPITFINASICSEGYSPVNKPFVLGLS